MEISNPIISIMGPTNTGKTSLAIQLSQRLNAEIISVDSVQIYKYANVGSNKLKPDSLRDYPHHLINILEPTDSYSVGNFRSDFLKIIDSLDKKNKSAILVGGTMMYFHALFNGISVLPKSDPKIRKKLDRLDDAFLNLIKKRTKLVDAVLKNKKYKRDIVDKKRIGIILKKMFSNVFFI